MKALSAVAKLDASVMNRIEKIVQNKPENQGFR